MPHESSASEILARTASLYVACRSYQDTGEVTTVIVMGNRPWNRNTKKTRFRTVFVRPDRLLFEYREVGLGPESEWAGGVSWGGATSARSWSTLMPDGSTHPSIVDAAGALAGLSHRVSSSIPFMLFNAEPRYFCLPDPSTAKLLGTDVFEGRECTKIEGLQQRGRLAVVWIEEVSGLLLKLESGSTFGGKSREEMVMGMREALAAMRPDDAKRSLVENAIARYSESRGPNFQTEETTVWRPVLDQPVDAASLEFTPPAESA